MTLPVLEHWRRSGSDRGYVTELHGGGGGNAAANKQVNGWLEMAFEVAFFRTYAQALDSAMTSPTGL